MRLFDLHCDTALGLYFRGADLYRNEMHISLERASCFEKYVQMTAIFTPRSVSDEEGWELFLKMREKLLSECEKYGVELILTAHDLEAFERSDRQFAAILTVEDARILGGKIERVRELYEAGVRLITPLWGGHTCIGGSHESPEGLTDFGKEAVREMLALGIIPDISHASDKSADKILGLCREYGKSAVASHSDSREVRPLPRNLDDTHYRALCELGGVVGINLCSYHLTEDAENASIADVVKHIAHYRSVNPGHTVFGCDYDGASVPKDLCEISALPRVADALRGSGFAEEEIDGIYWKTAYDFMKKNLPTR